MDPTGNQWVGNAVIPAIWLCFWILIVGDDFFTDCFFGLVACVCALVYAAKIKIGINGEFASSDPSYDVFESPFVSVLTVLFCWCRVRQDRKAGGQGGPAE